ncbi:hypothetical protein THRCLA_03246 [Thraustotheca clavata]|uniref:Secreted protein n=1 Tax=Thraustotheca clavata TaxID=74557 RepID=A0A1W0A2N7_9STRA|nr:hypothetical protein THRCLA_03246 [Thraustotheca clavata]
MKLLVLVACLLSLHAVQASSTPAICKNKKCLTSSGDTCDRATSTCGKCLSLSSSGDVKCKDTYLLDLCVSSTNCGEWSASLSSSGSGSGSSSGSSKNTTTKTPVPTQSTQPTQLPQPTQPTQAPPQTQSPKTNSPAPKSTEDISQNNTTAPATAGPSSSSSSTNWALYGGIGGAVVLLAIVAIVCCCIRKKRRDEDDDDITPVYSSKSNQVPQTTYAQTSTTTAPPPVVVVTEPTQAPTYSIPVDQSFQLPITPRSSSSNASLPRTSGMSGYEVQSNPLVNFISRAAVEESTANYRQNIAQKFNDLENFNEGVGSDSESEPSLNSMKRESNESFTNESFNNSEGSGDSFVATRGDNDRAANETTCSVEF